MALGKGLEAAELWGGGSQRFSVLNHKPKVCVYAFFLWILQQCLIYISKQCSFNLSCLKLKVQLNLVLAYFTGWLQRTSPIHTLTVYNVYSSYCLNSMILNQVLSVHSVYSLYNVYNVYIVYSSHSVYSVDSVWSVCNIYGVYSIYNLYSAHPKGRGASSDFT